MRVPSLLSTGRSDCDSVQRAVQVVAQPLVCPAERQAIATNPDQRSLVATIIGFGVDVLLNVLLVPWWGIRDAVWAAALSRL